MQYPTEYCLWYSTFSHFDISLLYIFSCMNSMWKKRTMNGEERNRSCFLFYFFIFTVPKKRNSESSRSAFLCNLEAVLFGQSFCYQTYPFKTLNSTISNPFCNSALYIEIYFTSKVLLWKMFGTMLKRVTATKNNVLHFSIYPPMQIFPNYNVLLK